MSYAIWEDVVSRYPEMARKKDALQTSSYWLTGASAEVDGRLAPRYATPFAAPVPPVVVDLTIDLAYYKMTYRDKGQDKLKKYLDERFEAIIDGTLLLTTSGGALTQPSQVALTTSGYGSSFGMDDPVNFQVSSAWQAASEDQR